MSHINARSAESIRLQCQFNAEDAKELQLLQAAYLAESQEMDLAVIVVELVHEALISRRLALEEYYEQSR